MNEVPRRVHEPSDADEANISETPERDEAAGSSEGELPQPQPAADVCPHGATDEDGVEVAARRGLQERHEQDEHEPPDDGAEVVRGVCG